MKIGTTAGLAGIMVVMVACGRESREASKAERDEAHARCVQTLEEDKCVEWARKALSEFPTEVSQAESEKAEIVKHAAHFGSEDLLGAQGAYTAKLGGLYADNDDVVKAVEMVDEGLATMQKGIQDHPEGKILRIYYIATISSLPEVFKKQQETLDSIASLEANFKLTESEGKIVLDAKNRVTSRKM